MIKRGRHIGFTAISRLTLILFCAMIFASLLACSNSLPASTTTTETIAAEFPTEAQVDSGFASNVGAPVSFTEVPFSGEITSAEIPTVASSPAMIVELPANTPSPLPARTNTPTARSLPTISIRPPLPAILIEAPGPLSKIASPISLKARAIPGEGGRVYIQVTGEDGRSIYEDAVDLSEYPYRRTYFTRKIDFTILPVAETVRITLSTRDYYGRIASVSSVDVIFLRLGDDLTNPASITEEPYIIQSPAPYQVISGGMVRVTGWLRPVNTSPLIADLVDTKGVVLASRSMPVTLIDSQQEYVPFALEIPYLVQFETRVRLTIHQDSDNRLPGVIQLNSLTLVLNP